MAVSGELGVWSGIRDGESIYRNRGRVYRDGDTMVALRWAQDVTKVSRWPDSNAAGSCRSATERVPSCMAARIVFTVSLFSGIVTRCANRVSRYNDLVPLEIY